MSRMRYKFVNMETSKRCESFSIFNVEHKFEYQQHLSRDHPKDYYCKLSEDPFDALTRNLHIYNRWHEHIVSVPLSVSERVTLSNLSYIMMGYFEGRNDSAEIMKEKFNEALSTDNVKTNIQIMIRNILDEMGT